MIFLLVICLIFQCIIILVGECFMRLLDLLIVHWILRFLVDLPWGDLFNPSMDYSTFWLMFRWISGLVDFHWIIRFLVDFPWDDVFKCSTDY